MTEPRPLVLDANILIRAVLGSRVRGIIERHVVHAGFFVPQCCVDEAREHLPAIVRKRGLYADSMTEAGARLAARDPLDADVLALALTLNCPIWTEDQDFFGAGVATWTSNQVERHWAS